MIKRFVSNQIKSLLMQRFGDKVEVVNESHLHSRGKDSHFKVVVGSDEFEGKSLVQRQRIVNKSLEKVWENGVHSISIHASTEAEFTGVAGKTPGCMQKNKK